MKGSIRVAAALCSILLLLSLAGICWAQNLVHNGGFETAGDGAPGEGWDFRAFMGADLELSLDTDIHQGGKASLKVEFVKEGGRAMLYPESEIAGVHPAKTYQVGLWIKADNLDYGVNFAPPALYVNFAPTKVRPNPIINFVSEMEGVRGWKYVSLTLKAPEDARKITFRIILTAGTVWLDDIAIMPVDGD
jgi:hypothetical protein